MKTLKEKCQEIRNELKKLGITSRQVSVKGSYSMYDDVIKITIKDLSVDINVVKEIAHKLREVDYCSVSGEILAGGNTYARVDYDWEVIRDARLLKEEDAQRIFNKVQGEKSLEISDQGRIKVIYYNDGHMSEIRVLEKPEGYENMNYYCYDTLFRRRVNNVASIAEALVYIENKMY